MMEAAANQYVCSLAFFQAGEGPVFQCNFVHISSCVVLIQKAVFFGVLFSLP